MTYRSLLTLYLLPATLALLLSLSQLNNDHFASGSSWSAQAASSASTSPSIGSSCSKRSRFRLASTINNKRPMNPVRKVLLATTTTSCSSAFVRSSAPSLLSVAASISSPKQEKDVKTTSSSLSKNTFRLRRSSVSTSAQLQQQKKSLVGPMYIIKTGLAGGIAGAVGTALLYPFDAAKTLRQSSPKEYPSVLAALKHMLLYEPNINNNNHHHHHIAAEKILQYPKKLSIPPLHIGRVYKGIFTSSLGAIPSSALYFGAYETSKTNLRRLNLFSRTTSLQGEESFYQRLFIHATAAACGNVMSSAIFVPKELIKSKMQFLATSTSSSGWALFQSTIQSILQEKGTKGLYCGYRAVLMRNIPTAALRFCLYEEFRRIVLYDAGHKNNDNEHQGWWKLFVAGAMAGAAASGIMTPVDVLKTRVSTGFCPIEPGSLFGCVQLIIQDSGWKSLYAGAGSRIFFSAAFSGVGFGTFEMAKKYMGISSNDK